MKNEFVRMCDCKKPPLRLTPRYIAERIRLNEVESAITRYIEADYPIPAEWIEEYNELVKRAKVSV